VDADDYDVWRTTFGSNTMLAADGNKDNIINAADYVNWRRAVQPVGGDALAVAVPEPRAIAILAFAAFATVFPTRSWKRLPRE
jgi:hypothetical protein